MTATYQDVDQMIRDGASAEEIEVVLADERTALTEAQIEDLRSDLAARDEDAAGEPDRLQGSLEAAAEALDEERRQPVPPPSGYFEG